VKVREATIFGSFTPPKLCESMFLETLLVEPFYFITFGTKRLETVSKVAREVVPNETLVNRGRGLVCGHPLTKPIINMAKI
jgi:hypothetical protein